MDLNCRGEQKDINTVFDQGLDRILKRRNFCRESPVVNMNGEHLRSTFLKAVHQVLAGNSVFLHRNSATLQRYLVDIKDLQYLPPGVWFRDIPGDRHAQLFESSDGLGTAG